MYGIIQRILIHHPRLVQKVFPSLSNKFSSGHDITNPNFMHYHFCEKSLKFTPTPFASSFIPPKYVPFNDPCTNKAGKWTMKMNDGPVSKEKPPKSITPNKMRHLHHHTFASTFMSTPNQNDSHLNDPIVLNPTALGLHLSLTPSPNAS